MQSLRSEFLAAASAQPSDALRLTQEENFPHLDDLACESLESAGSHFTEIHDSDVDK
jgi:hypothetical protein